MADRIRVLVVDDAVVIRRLLGDLIESDPELELVGVAANGRIALQRIEQLKPDVVTLDIEMPELDGLGTLRELRPLHPRLPVIMFSTLSVRGGEATLEALSLGASDYVTKPANVGSVTEGMQRVRDELIPKIKALAGRPAAVRPAAVAAAARPATRRLGSRPIAVVAIGCSTGGPNALAEVIGALPAGLPVPVVITQHMPPVFTRLLAERLDASTAVTVVEATHGMALEPGHVYIAPGDHHLRVRRSLDGTVRTTLDQEAPESSCRPAVDPLFRSVADVYGGDVLAVVLTGMGYDGLKGVEVLAPLGARVLVQDQATSVVWGMPGAVAGAGLADDVVPLALVGPSIVDLVGASHLQGALR
jgi:two-component system chemotaxis response regulator CheB